MNLRALENMLRYDLGFKVDDTEYDGIIWTLEEHCYTAYPDQTEVYDSEGELPESISKNLEALRWYFEYELLKQRIEGVLYDED
ncbi:hypothetical protein VPH184E373B_0260 [Vibrio phage 184E37-3b]|nr:hypothetical protein MYOV056v2_p0232 [Vibrio phage 184E37.3a]QZI90072.1 hypothetical protein MYOV057v1_p0157 [Vibrio phage 184E37.1]